MSIMKEITYNLETDSYYEDVNYYSKEVIAKIEAESSEIITDFMDFIADEELERLRTKEEYLFEFLVLGVLANQYLNNALETSKSSYLVLEKVKKLKTKNSKLVSLIDRIWGSLSTWLLHAEDRSDYSYEFVNKNDFKKLLQWLRVTGKYQLEVERLSKWKEYFNSKFSVEVSYDLKIALNLALWFKEKSKKRLGKYTRNIESFLKNKQHNYLWKSDVMLCSKPEIEYHLNLVGAEIINQSARSDFLATEEKIILAPTCMRNRSAESCQAEEKVKGMKCTHCDRDCNINLISSLGNQGEFEVLLIDHASDFANYLNALKNNNNLGVIIITCALNLLLAGYQSKKFSIPAQIIPLDYCGCNKHWCQGGVATDINLDQLLEVLQADPNDKFIQMRFFNDQ